VSISFAIILGLIQAFTEFLPVSSSGHLAVAEIFLKPFYGNFRVTLFFNLLLHMASLIVIVFFLRKEIAILIKALFSQGSEKKQAWSFVWVLAVATLPAVIVGLVFNDSLENNFNSLIANGYCFLITAALLEVAYRNQRNKKPEELNKNFLLGWEYPNTKQAFLIGVAQAFALFPAISRSGTTVVSGLLLKIKPEACVRFSLFMAVPAILGAFVLEFSSIGEIAKSDYPAYFWGFMVCLIGSWLAVYSLIWVVKKVKYRYFAVYTFLLAIFLLIYGYSK
jgi:undecaprenyl-diphosphatase